MFSLNPSRNRKLVTFQITIRNVSAWPIDIVWENAQDLEHVAVLHGETNEAFELLDVQASRDGASAYESLMFIVKRKLLGVLPVVNFGFRRIVGRFEIWQMEVNPLLRMMTTLRSTLERNAAEPHKTDLVDQVEITMPRILRRLKPLVEAALRRHTRIQCQEDEAFRARRYELRRRGINLPLSPLHQPLWEARFGRFTPTDAGEAAGRGCVAAGAEVHDPVQPDE